MTEENTGTGTENQNQNGQNQQNQNNGSGAGTGTENGNGNNTQRQNQQQQQQQNTQNQNGNGSGEEDRSGWTTDQWQAELDKWKSHSRKNEKSAKDNADAAAELEKIKESQKTEQQKLQDRLDKQEHELQSFRVGQIRREAAVKVGLTDPDLIGFITATDADEAENQAKTLLSKFGSGNNGNGNGNNNGSQAPNFGQGNRQAPPKDEDPNTALRRAFGRG